MDEKVRKIFESQDEETLRAASKPVSVEMARNSFWGDCTGQTIPDISELFGELSTFWVHAQIKRDCYYFYSKYRYHAWVTSDKAGKKKIKADKIELKMDSGNGSFKKSSKKVSQVKKLDEVYGTDNTCKSAKLIAKATIGSSSATVEVKLK
jgi:hypothetical protein